MRVVGSLPGADGGVSNPGRREAGGLMMESLRSLLKGAQDLGLTLSPAQLRLFQTYADELVAWNQRLSLTAIISPEEIQVKHFLDSLTCLRALPPGFVCRRVLDVGSGGGFPGLPLKIQDHTLQVTLLESTIKKAEFLRHIVRRLELPGVEVVAERAETLGQNPAYRETYDLVAARAVAELAVLAEYCLPFCRVGGLFVAQKKAGNVAEIKNAQDAVTTLGGRMLPPIAILLPGVEPRQLVVVEKVCQTPARYPRRPGMPAKRPLA
jgi:16S rRNA (guanine527-N7)-methyltransferase